MRLVTLRRRSRALAVLAGLVLAVLLPQGTASAADPITTAWTATGGASGPLGVATGAEDCSSLPNAGCMQTFEHGTFYWSPAHAALWVPAGPIATAWAATGGVSGGLGWPWRNPICDGSGGCRQLFQQGWIADSPSTGTHLVPTYAPFGSPTPSVSIGPWWSFGQLGYPTGDVVCGVVESGCRQTFELGSLYAAPGYGYPAVAMLPNPVTAYWTSAGAEQSAAGYPTGPFACDTSGSNCWQRFERGYIASSAGQVHAVPDALAWAWGGTYGPSTGGGNLVPAIGMPVAEATCYAGLGCEQHFSQGTLVAYGNYAVTSMHDAIATYYDAVGGLNSSLIAPRSEQYATAGGGQSQYFWGSNAGAEVHWSPATGAHAVLPPITTAYDPQRGESGALGYPVGEQFCGLRNGGCGQHFQGGSIYWSPSTGAHPVSGAIRGAWSARGWETSSLGYPTGDMFCGLRNGGCGQHFQGGSIYWSPATGAHPVSGAIRGAWSARGWETSSLGYPTGDMFCGLRNGGCGQHFQGGSIYWSPATGAHPVSGAIRGAWSARGWETSSLGYPTGDMFCGLRNGGCGQHFQGGSIYWSPATGAHPVTGAIRSLWAARGWETSWLGYPTDDAVPVGGGRYSQRFQGGSLTA